MNAYNDDDFADMIREETEFKWEDIKEDLPAYQAAVLIMLPPHQQPAEHPSQISHPWPTASSCRVPAIDSARISTCLPP